MAVDAGHSSPSLLVPWWPPWAMSWKAGPRELAGVAPRPGEASRPLAAAAGAPSSQPGCVPRTAGAGGRLASQLEHKFPNDLPHEPGLERMFTFLYQRFEPEQAELHSVIRAYTEHALYPINEAIAEWLQADVDYRTIRGKSDPEVQLAKLLNDLDCHLTLLPSMTDGPGTTGPRAGVPR